MSVATVTATVDTTNVPPRVRLDVADTGSPAFASVTVTRLNPDGTTVPVRTADGNPLPMSAGAGLVYDYEAPFGQSVTYSTQETPANVTAAVTVPASQVWLIHPGIPTLSQTVDLLPGSLVDETYTAKQAIFWPMGRTTPVVIGDGSRKAAQSSLTMLTETLVELASLRSLLADASVLLLNIPTQLGLGFDTCYISIQDVKISRLTDVVIDEYRSVTAPFTVVARPAGGSQSQRSYADLLVYPSYSSLQGAYTDYAALLAGP